MRSVPPRIWRLARFAAFAALTVGIGAALRAVNWPRTGDAIRQANAGWLAVAVAANAAILLCWTAFWRALWPPSEARASVGRTLEIVTTSSALMNTLPFGGGHASSIVLLIRRGGMTRRGALSVLALDQLGEGVVKIGVFLLVGLLVPLPAWMRIGVITATVAVSAWLLTLVVASTFGAVRELGILSRWRHAGRALACVAAMKCALVLAIITVQRAFGVDVSIGGSLLVVATTLLAAMVPVSPGNLGTYEASVFVAYRYLGVSPTLALSLAIVQHACFMIAAVGPGYCVLAAQMLSRRSRAIASP